MLHDCFLWTTFSTAPDRPTLKYIGILHRSWRETLKNTIERCVLCSVYLDCFVRYFHKWIGNELLTSSACLTLTTLLTLMGKPVFLIQFFVSYNQVCKPDITRFRTITTEKHISFVPVKSCIFIYD